jgi:hypothetical protein
VNNSSGFNFNDASHFTGDIIVVGTQVPRESESTGMAPRPETDGKPPIADAGPDKEVYEGGETITLDGTDSTDEDGNIVSYKWNIEEWDDEDP